MGNLHQSKRGWHPCEYSIYLKLKQIRKWYFKTLHDYATYNRWVNKKPENRLIRKWIKDNLGRRIGFEITGDQSEPKYCKSFVSFDKRYWRNMCFNPFEEDYQNARIPKSKEEVKPLQHTVEEIVKFYDTCLSELKN